MKYYYLAYGSNLNIKQMKKICPNSIIIGTTILHNHKLIYKGIDNELGYLTIEYSKNDIVPLGIYELTLTDLIYLDIYEGYPDLYQKYNIEIEIDGNKEDAIFYIMNEENQINIPSKEYKEICEEGYRIFNFDKKILEKAYNETISVKSKKLIK